ncbi:hypothetical protein QT711_11435 [Sporosarcina saromensis]|uniref:Uncharacterized protein n=1 Tax=Sporosarcina saromensis TaxID=359365 RepID=A0ABU4GBW9_9BACL|nr:hypothetical protein [Sporosarcina saromensis]MDW0113800.1 hypothetical protein [Sporosarcina saromensis]
MPEWIQSGGIYYVQPTKEYSKQELDAQLDELFAKIEAAKLKRKGMTA